MIDIYFINCILAQLTFSLFLFITIIYKNQSLDQKLKNHEYKNRADESNPMPYIGSTFL